MGGLQGPVPGHPEQRQQPGEDHRQLSDRGAGLVSTMAGVVVFIAFLLFAVQLVFNLYATSTVTAVGHDAARAVASRRVDHRNPASVAGAQREATARARRQLGRYGNLMQLSWDGTDGEVVRLRIRAQNPHVGFGSLLGPLSFDRIDRTITVRVERFR